MTLPSDQLIGSAPNMEDTDGITAQVSIDDGQLSAEGCGRDVFLQAVLPLTETSGTSSSLSCSGRQSGSNTGNYSRAGGLAVENPYSGVLFNCGESGWNESEKAVVEEGKERRLECPFCRRELNTRFAFKMHLQSHTGKPYQCMICGRAFAQKGNVTKHIERHKVYPNIAVQGESTLSTGNVGMQTRAVSFQLLDNSNIGTARIRRGDKCKASNDSKTAYRCPYCADLFHCHKCIKGHMPSHKDRKVFECPLQSCGQLFPKLEEFLAHVSGHRDQLTYDCPICGRTFQSLSDVGVHQCAHVIANEKRHIIKKSYRCMECGDVFKSALSLERHYARTSHHYRCFQCNRVYASPRILRKHLKSHQQSRSSVCSLCNKAYVNGWLLKWHVKSVHGAAGDRFHCTVCSKTFTRRDVLQRHEASVHSSGSTFCCTFEGCERKFKRQDRLKEHVMTHGGVKKHQCNSCGKSFMRLQAYKMHIRSVHEKVYRFHCDGCKKGFNRPDKYGRHRKACKHLNG